MTQDEALLEAVKSDYRKAHISTAERATLDFAVKLTTSPNQMARIDLQPLTEQGFDDTAILEIVQIVGFFNYINRVADALGVDPEPEWAQPGGQDIKYNVNVNKLSEEWVSAAKDHDRAIERESVDAESVEELSDEE